MGTDKRKVTPTKESTKKKSSKSSSSTSADEIKALDAKWLERFSRLEACMLLANSFQATNSQPTFQQISMPVSPKKQSLVGHSLQNLSSSPDRSDLFKPVSCWCQ